jgi:hypothetical protein
MENSGKQNSETGFKSPTEQRRKSSRPQETTASIEVGAAHRDGAMRKSQKWPRSGRALNQVIQGNTL